jgi:hypothetical protein
MFANTGRISRGGKAHHGIALFAAIVAILACGQGTSAVAQDRWPVKLEVVPSAHAVDVGSGVTLDVILRAADNGVAAAPKELSIQFDIKAPSGPVAEHRDRCGPERCARAIPGQRTRPVGRAGEK